jgi:hypothetical protein
MRGILFMVGWQLAQVVALMGVTILMALGILRIK